MATAEAEAEEEDEAEGSRRTGEQQRVLLGVSQAGLVAAVRDPDLQADRATDSRVDSIEREAPAAAQSRAHRAHTPHHTIQGPLSPPPSPSNPL